MTQPVHSLSPGRHRVPCPNCRRDHQDRTLGVTVSADGAAVWHCFRCGMVGNHIGELGGWRARCQPLTSGVLSSHEHASVRAANIFEGCGSVDSAQTYLVAKRVGAYGIRQMHGTAGPLVIPLRDVGGIMWSLQFISASGEKRFLKGCRTKGVFHTIGGPLAPSSTILICEGYATGATLHEQTGGSVICAMTAGNLLPVAQCLRSTYPQTDIVVCADDDRFTEANPGLSKATEAAAAIRGRLCKPSFRPGSCGTDFNDAWIEESEGQLA